MKTIEITVKESELVNVKDGTYIIDVYRLDVKKSTIQKVFHGKPTRGAYNYALFHCEGTEAYIIARKPKGIAAQETSWDDVAYAALE